MIRELRRLEGKHKNDTFTAGADNWSRMCHDIANKLEQLSNMQHFEDTFVSVKLMRFNKRAFEKMWRALY
jgi:hypothetical protein